jgi:hypothetical protein
MHRPGRPTFSKLTGVGKESVLLEQTMVFLKARRELDRPDQLTEEESKFFEMVQGDTSTLGTD